MRVSNLLTDEFLDSDYVVVGMPMYNWGVPANVKAWIDQIVRLGKTFNMTENEIVGLAQPNKKVIALISRSGYYLKGEPYEAVNFQDGNFTGIMNFMGVKEVYLEALQDVFNHDEFESKLNAASERVRLLAKKI